MKIYNDAPKEIALLTTDIRQYSTITANMTAKQIRDFMFGYYNVLQIDYSGDTRTRQMTLNPLPVILL